MHSVLNAANTEVQESINAFDLDQPVGNEHKMHKQCFTNGDYRSKPLQRRR